MWLRLLIIFLFSGSAAFAGEVRYQDNHVHQRVLTGEWWNGSYLFGFYNRDENWVRISLCDHGSDSNCRLLGGGQLKIEDLRTHNAVVLEKLREYRQRHYEKVKSSMWTRILRNPPEKDSNLRSLDLMISEISAEGLDRWILQRDKPKSPQERDFSSSHVFHEMAKVLDEALKQPVRPSPQTPPDPCASPSTAVAALCGGTVIR